MRAQSHPTKRQDAKREPPSPRCGPRRQSPHRRLKPESGSSVWQPTRPTLSRQSGGVRPRERHSCGVSPWTHRVRELRRGRTRLGPRCHVPPDAVSRRHRRCRPGFVARPDRRKARGNVPAKPAARQNRGCGPQDSRQGQQSVALRCMPSVYRRFPKRPRSVPMS